jgi:glycosyltransferase involved in cell wall biosynthesis
MLSMLPQQVAARLLKQLRRRTHEGLASQRVRTYPVAEIIFLLFTRLPALKGFAEKVMHLRNEYFDSVVGQTVRKLRPRAVICYDSCALKTFEAAKEVGTLCILDQVIGHIKTGAKILSEERQLHPDFADSIPDSATGWALARCTKEAIVADMVLAASEYVRDSLISNGVSPSRIALCPYGVDTERFRPAVKVANRPFQILFVGQLSQRKGIKYLLEAFKNLHLEKAELVMMGGVGGSGEGLKSYEGLFRHIKHVPYSELPQYYQSADIFVYPSLHEGSALAIYEALASGLPVITTPNSGSVVRDGVEGFIVPIRDTEALKDKLLLLYHNKDIRDQMSLQARKRAESFTWQAYRQRLGSLVQNFIEESES